VIVPVPIRAARARPFLPGDVELIAPGGWTVGGVLLACYDETATMAYRELIVFAGMVRAARRAGMWVAHIVVDLEASVAGGREIWGLPKVLERDTAHLVRAQVRWPRLRVPVPLTPAVFGRAADGGLLWTATAGTLHGGAALARLDVPPGSPLAPLGLDGTWPAIAGHALDLPFPAPAGLR
jgi:acetoacetate decarboxylase